MGDKDGKLKFESSSDKVYPGLKLEAKADVVATDAKVKAGLTYTEIKDTQLKFEADPTNPANFVFEATRKVGDATLGVKCTAANIKCPDVGLRFLSGQGFFSLIAKEKLSVYTLHGHYKASPELRCSATYEHGGKKNGTFSLGIAYDLMKGTKIKAKVQQEKSPSVSCTVKHDLSKGFTVLAGGKYDITDGQVGYGLQLSIE